MLAFAYGTVVLYACTMADRMIFMPPEASYAPEEEGAVIFGDQGEFAGFYFPAPDAEAPTLLWAHGNAEDAGHARGLARGFQAEGVGVMIYDYPGYGHSKGKPSEKGAYRSAEAAFDFVTREQGREPKSVVLLGQSVGGGPSVYLAEKGEAAGLVLISPFKSAFRVVTRVKILPWDRFDNLKRMKSVELPLLVIHGSEDEVVPASHGEALHKVHEGEKKLLLLPGVGHNDLWPLASEKVLSEVIKFSRKVVRPLQ